MLMCRLGMTVGILAVRLSRRGMHLRLGMFTQLVAMGRFPVVMCGRFML